MQYVTDLSKVCSKSSVRPELGKVLFGKDVVVATDGYRLVELKSEGSIGALVNPKLLKKGDVVESNEDGTLSIVRDGLKTNIGNQDSDEKYPSYKSILDAQVNAEGYKCLVNRKYLVEILNAFPDAKVSISVPKETGKALVISTDGGVGVLMPMTS